MSMNQSPQGETKQSATRTIDAPAKDVFEVLTLPEKHKLFDSSGFVVDDEKTQRIQKVGDVFTMNMQGDHMGGEYQTDNHVVAYDENKLVGWATAPAGTEPPGWQWIWSLEADGQDSTVVTLTYDWSKVTDPDLLAKNLFPLLSQEQLEESLAKLASAVA